MRMLHLWKSAQILIHITTKLVLPVIDEVPISFHKPLFRNGSEATCIASPISNGPIQCDDCGRGSAQEMNFQESMTRIAARHTHLSAF